MNAPPPPVSPWQELERRKVLRVGVGYVTTVFALFEAILFLIEGMDTPDWLLRALLGAAVLGFPLAIVLAWQFDVTPEGVERTPEDATDDPGYGAGPARRWLTYVVVTVVAGLALRFLRG